jgi:hypothetical protein
MLFLMIQIIQTQAVSKQNQRQKRWLATSKMASYGTTRYDCRSCRSDSDEK